MSAEEIIKIINEEYWRLLELADKYPSSDGRYKSLIDKAYEVRFLYGKITDEDIPGC